MFEQRGLISNIKNFYRTFVGYLKSFYISLHPLKQTKRINTWKLDYQDFICFAAMLSVTLLMWISVMLTGNANDILYYWDGPNYLFAGITLYDIKEDNPWTKYFKYKPSYFACHLPGFPLLIKICSFFSFGNYIVGDFLAIIMSGLILSYSFRRLLIVYDCVSDPTFTTILLSCIPMRLVIYHSVGASEPLFISFVCLSFIFYKLDRFTPMLLCVWAGCITRIEGMAIGAAIGACYILKLQILNGLKMFLTFVSTAFLLLLHRGMFNDSLAYIHFNSGQQNLIRWPPFPELTLSFFTSTLYYHSFFDLYFLYFIGAFMLAEKTGPVSIFVFIYLMYISLLRHMDIPRYSLPAAVFCVLIGFDKLWSHSITKRATLIVLPFYVVELMLYASGQVHSNVCQEFFFNEVLAAAQDHLH